jgi:exonuclease III
LHGHCNKNKFMILHQNIRRIFNKVDEFLNSVSPKAPQVICLSEHHLRTEEISNVNFNQYTLGASLCRQTYSHGGVCVFVHKNMQFNNTNLDQYNKEKDLEICALKLNIVSNNFTIICLHRSPTGNFSYFLNQLESILNKVYKTSNELILCGDLNINYHNDNSRKDLLDSLLVSFNLVSTVKFPTRISNNSCTLIDNIYINTYRYEFSVHPLLTVCQTMMLRLLP